jgi:signal transduction histidine kinase
MEILQQQQILQVTLNTQEEERRRISESLHNGVGQLLYGTQLSMNQMTAKDAADNPEKFNAIKAYTAGLLGQSIGDIRRISHELMPAVLAGFGLQAALEDICRQFQNGLNFHCRIELNDSKLDDYLELAVFRTVQELAINVVKHAQANRCDVVVIAEGNQLLVRVSDNGRGMEKPGKEDHGIGLSSIRHKVDLLKGSIAIKTKAEKGTTVELYFPIQSGHNK